jgi:hypothetical protein
MPPQQRPLPPTWTLRTPQATSSNLRRRKRRVQRPIQQRQQRKTRKKRKSEHATNALCFNDQATK